jgi:hypothetical protein
MINIMEYLNNAKEKAKIDRMTRKALSDKELKRILGANTKVLLYPDLAKYETVEELLPQPNDFAIILIVEDENRFNIDGHWTVLLRYDNTYEYFDPYGNPVDYDLINWMDKKQRVKLHENKKYLTYLLQGRTHIYNRVRYEELRKGVNTCGSHSAYRCYKFKKYGFTLSDYQQHMNTIRKNFSMSYDKIVAAFVSFFLQ